MYPAIRLSQHPARLKIWLIFFFALVGLTTSLPTAVTALVDGDVSILSPDNGAILDGVVTLQANVASVDPIASVEFFYDPHEDDEPEISLGMASLNPTTGFWEMAWDTTTVADTFNDIDTNGDDIEDTTVNITKPPTHDGLRVVATAVDLSTAEDALDVRIQNMLTVRFTLPDNQEDLRGFTDLEAILTSKFDITSVSFDVYNIADADPDILTPFGEFESLGEPIENRYYGRPLGAPAFPTGSPAYAIGSAAPEGSNTKRWVIRSWDTTQIPDGTWLIVATATDSGGRTATYMVETYIVNDLRVAITAPDDGDEVSRFVPLEARTSSLTGADNAAPGSLWPATAVDFTIDNGVDPTINLSATEIPAGSGRWRAVWDGDAAAPGGYTITATATNANPNGPELATDTINVTLVPAGAALEAFFPFDWSYCYLTECSLLDGSGGGPNWWLWDFGDGNTSTDQNPTHSYATYGIYTVTLTVSNDGGTTTETYSREIPVGNTPAVSFNRNDLDIGGTEFIDWTSAFKDFDYAIGSTLAIPVMWETTVGSAEFNTMPTTICDDDETSSNQECVIFTPEEAFGTAPTVVGTAESGVLFTMEFTEVQFRGTTDIFKGKANIRIVVDVDTDGNGSFDQQNQLGTNVDVTNDGLPDPVLVAITSPLEGEQVGGIASITAATISSVTADQMEFFVNNSSIGTDTDGSDGWSFDWNTAAGSDGPYQLSVVATGTSFAATSPVVNVIVANAPPTAVIDSANCVGLTCTFDGASSSATNGVIEDHTWTFLDGTALLGTRNGAASTFVFAGEGPYTVQLTVTDSVGVTGSAETTVTPSLKPTTFQVGFASDEVNQYLTFPYELCIPEEGEDDCTPGGPPPFTPLDASMSANFSNIAVIPGGGVIGGDLLELDVTITNTSPLGSGIILSAYAFQSKVSESPALGSRVGDKAFYGQVVPGSLVTTADSPLVAVKKNGTSNGLFTGEWKGICINSSVDFIPEFNSGLEDETLECAGNRADTNADGEPELQTGADMLGLRPGESQTIRILIDSGTTDGALHVVEPGTLTGVVTATEVIGPNGLTYYVPTMETIGNVLGIPDFGDNKVLRDADGTFNPTFAPAADGYTFENQIYLTLPRENFAFTDIIGRNHTCATYGLTEGQCDPSHPDYNGGQPFLNFLETGDLVPGVQNFAAILRGYGEFYDANGDFLPDINPDTGDVQPSYPYGVRCDNCGGQAYVPIAEFYYDNGDGTVTRQIVGGTYGDPVADPYLTLVNSLTAEHIKQEIIPEPDPGGPCQGGERKPACARLGTSAVGEFYDLTVIPGGGTNGGDAVEFTIDITNSSSNPDAYLTAFSYQTKSRGLADIGVLDGYTQDRRDIRMDWTLPPCTSLADFACWNADLGIGQFPNVIGNGLLFGQMVWQSSNDAGREGPVIPDQVYVDPINGIDPVHYQLESVKKNGPFAPILKGNVNFICIKSGLFDNDPDSDAACAGEPAILIDPNGAPVPGNIDTSAGPNQGRLGLPPGVTQSVRIRMEWGDFRGAMLQIVAGTLNAGNVHPDHVATGGLARDFDCSDQRELEWCHPENVGVNIGYLPNTDATWLTPQTLEDIEYVIINQPGDAPLLMNFQENFGYILAMAGFVPSAEFYAPDPNEELIGTPYEGILIQQQVLGTYSLTTVPPSANQPPTASFTYNCTNLSCDFDASGSSDGDGSIVSYEWDFGDGNMGSGLLPAHSYASDGTYSVTLTVLDNEGTSASEVQNVEVMVVGNITGTGSSSTTFVSQTITWISAFTDEGYVVGDTIIVPASWTAECGTTSFNPNNRPSGVVPNGGGFSPSGVTGTAPTVLSSTNNSALFSFSFTNVASLGTAKFQTYVGVDRNCDGTVDREVRLIVSVHVVKSQAPPPPTSPVITSLPVTLATEGQSYLYQVSATGSPAPTFSLDVAPLGMSIDSSTGLVSWTSGAAGMYDVTIRAANGNAPDAVQSFQIEVSDEPTFTYQLMYSLSSDRSNAVPLDGATVLATAIYIFVLAEDNVQEVSFYLDGAFQRTDTSAPFDLVGGNLSQAKPLRLNRMPDGTYTVDATVTLSDSSVQALTANFTLDN